MSIKFLYERLSINGLVLFQIKMLDKDMVKTVSTVPVSDFY